MVSLAMSRIADKNNDSLNACTECKARRRKRKLICRCGHENQDVCVHVIGDRLVHAETLAEIDRLMLAWAEQYRIDGWSDIADALVHRAASIRRHFENR
jgi:hypothetical protein